MKFKSDRYRTARGGWSRFLNLSCAKCGTPLITYQKDGPGPYIYKKKRRAAIRRFQDAITKKMTKA